MPYSTPCSKCPLRKRNLFRPLGEKELDFVSQFKVGELVVDAGSTILLEENPSPHFYTVLDGWAFRHKSLPTGDRQVLNFALPGDLIGLQMALMDEMQHSVTALTDTTLCVFERGEVWTIFEGQPALSFSMTWLAAREEQMLDGHILSLGQRSALQRAAYLMLHIYDRAERVGYAGNLAMTVPFTQQHIADALGITPVHTSRTLKKLQSRDLISWTDTTVVIRDREGLETVADYDDPPLNGRPLI